MEALLGPGGTIPCGTEAPFGSAALPRSRVWAVRLTHGGHDAGQALPRGAGPGGGGCQLPEEELEPAMAAEGARGKRPRRGLLQPEHQMHCAPRILIPKWEPCSARAEGTLTCNVTAHAMLATTMWLTDVQGGRHAALRPTKTHSERIVRNDTASHIAGSANHCQHQHTK